MVRIRLKKLVLPAACKVRETMLQPQSLAEIREICASSDKLMPVGARTKSALAVTDRVDVTLLDMRRYSGIVSYDPSEFLVSVRSGTTIQELSAALAAEGQYLPFDPVFAARGATIGGSIASGISGPCRLLYGTLRDFMLEVALCDSAGREIRGGGKVVKNAAGFDLPKLVVGSYGRLAVITEATLKVFPSPQGWMTVQYDARGSASALEIGMKLLSLPLPIAAMEIEQPARISIRLAGPLDSLAGMAQRVVAHIGTREQITLLEPGVEELRSWTARAEFAWADGAAALVRVALTHNQCGGLCASLDKTVTASRRVISGGAALMWIALDRTTDLVPLDAVLQEHRLSGVVACGAGPLKLLGDARWVSTAERIQRALDPDGKMLAYA